MNIKAALEKLAKSIDPDQNLIRIAAIGSASSASQQPIVLSLVNIAENPLRKNQSIDFSKPQFQKPEWVLSILFSTVQLDYLDEMDKLQKVIDYLERNHLFEDFEQNSTQDATKSNLIFKVEQVSLSIEQNAQLWTCLGLGYRPSVLYKLTFEHSLR